MKIERSWPIFLISLAWLLMTACPPWQAIEYPQIFSADPVRTLPSRVIDGYCQYAPIFAAPDPHFKCYYQVHIDFIRLGIQYLIAALLILLFVKLTKSNFQKLVAVLHDKPAKVKLLAALFKGLSVICIVTCFSLVAPDIRDRSEATNPGTNQIMRSSVIYLVRDIQAGAILTPEMIGLHMIEVQKIPSNALRHSTEAVGGAAKGDLPAGTLLTRDNIELKHE